MIIIISQKDVSVIDRDNQYVGEIGEITSRAEFEQTFGISFAGVDTIAYEPDRNLFHIQREGRVDAFQSADQDPLLVAIAAKEAEIKDHFELVCLEKVKPSSYHVLENKVWTISEENQAKLDREAFEADFRKQRDALLVEADILINKAADLGQDTAALRAYRQALRDATVSWVMPTKP
jgi:hypothetical protein